MICMCFHWQELRLTGSSNASMRTNLNDKLTKLHVKHQAEIDFLEDMRYNNTLSLTIIQITCFF